MIRKFLTTAVAVGAVVAAACSDAPMTGPAPLQRTSAYSPAEHRADNSWRAGAVQCEQHPAYVGSAEIGPRGGQIVVGRSRVIVPPGALDRTVRITATIPAGDHVEIYFDFEPHGLVFRKPAGLVLDASGCDIPSYYAPNIAYVGENGETLEYIQSYYSNYWHFVAAPIWHFSRYHIAW